MATRLLLLDRDGVILRLVDDLRSARNWSEVSTLPFFEDLLHVVPDLGLPIAVVTNQPEVRRGLVDRDWVESVNGWILNKLPKHSRIYTCWHDESDGCSCRKPRPGLLRQALADFNTEPSQAVMVGDTWRDERAAEAAGVRFLSIKHLTKCKHLNSRSKRHADLRSQLI